MTTRTVGPAMNRPVVHVHTPQSDDPKGGIIKLFEQMLSEEFRVVYSKEVDGDQDLAAQIQGLVVIPSRTSGAMERLDNFPNLKVVANHGVGTDHLPLKMLSHRGIKVSNTPSVLSDAVADQAFALILASARNLLAGVQEAMYQDPVDEFDANVFGVDVCNSTLGIVGMGGIGYKIAQRAQGFNMTVLYYNRHKRSKEEEEAVNATYYNSLSEMLPRCDFVVISCPHTKETDRLIGEAEFNMMKSTATFVNVARGKIVDHDALLKVLREKRIRGAALDVTDPEPLPRDHPLLKMDTVLVTPHIGSATIQARRKMYQTVIDNLKAGIIENKALPNEVKPK